MRKNRKRLLAALALMLGLAACLGGEYLWGRADFHKLIAVPPDEEYEITVRCYAGGRTITVADNAERQAIIAAVADLRYGGQTEAWYFQSTGSEYDLCINASDGQRRLFLSNDEQKPSYIYGRHNWLLANPETLYQLVEEIYGKNITEET